VGLVTLPTMNVEVTREDDNHLVVETRGQTLPVHRGMTADEATDGFMASELLLGGLGACMLGTALTFARNTDMPLVDLRVVTDADSAANPERLQTMTATGLLTDRHLASLSRVAARCKIHNTLADPPTVELSLILDDR
jgi:uncharacterized OsmC-like protein